MTSEVRTFGEMPSLDDRNTEEHLFCHGECVYPDVDIYLNVQFRLFREDFFQMIDEGFFFLASQIRTRPANFGLKI